GQQELDGTRHLAPARVRELAVGGTAEAVAIEECRERKRAVGDGPEIDRGPDLLHLPESAEQLVRPLGLADPRGEPLKASEQDRRDGRGDDLRRDLFGEAREGALEAGVGAREIRRRELDERARPRLTAPRA